MTPLFLFSMIYIQNVSVRSHQGAVVTPGTTQYWSKPHLVFPQSSVLTLNQASFSLLVPTANANNFRRARSEWQRVSIPAELLCSRRLQCCIAAAVVEGGLPVPAGGRGVTYSGGGVGGGGALAGDGALALAQVPLALTNQRPLVALHALQLLFCSHPPTRPNTRRLDVLQVQSAQRSVLLTPGGKRRVDFYFTILNKLCCVSSETVRQ